MEITRPMLNARNATAWKTTDAEGRARYDWTTNAADGTPVQPAE